MVSERKLKLFGVWDNQTDGFVHGPFRTRAKAVQELGRWINSYAVTDTSALEVVEHCPDHVEQEQPKIGCGECEIEEDGDD